MLHNCAVFNPRSSISELLFVKSKCNQTLANLTSGLTVDMYYLSYIGQVFLKPGDSHEWKRYEPSHITNAKINYSRRGKSELIYILPNVASVKYSSK